MVAIRRSSWIVAAVAAGAIALGAGAAEAGRVQDAVVSLKDALADISIAESFYASESDPSILSGLSEYSAALRFRPEVGSKILDAYVDTTTRRERRTLARALTDNVKEATRGSGNRQALRDVFYIDFIGSIQRLTGGGIELRTELALLFGGPDRATRLIDRYRLAVSRTK